MHILVVEDERRLAGLVRRALEEEGHVVDVSFDGAIPEAVRPVCRAGEGEHRFVVPASQHDGIPAKEHGRAVLDPAGVRPTRREPDDPVRRECRRRSVGGSSIASVLTLPPRAG